MVIDNISLREDSVPDRSDCQDKIVFTKEETLQSYGTYHESEKLNQEQAARLIQNVLQKREELLDEVLIEYYGRMPSRKHSEKHVKIISVPGEGGQPSVNHFFHKRKCLAVFTDPIRSIKKNRFYLTWFFKKMV